MRVRSIQFYATLQSVALVRYINLSRLSKADSTQSTTLIYCRTIVDFFIFIMLDVLAAECKYDLYQLRMPTRKYLFV